MDFKTLIRHAAALGNKDPDYQLGMAELIARACATDLTIMGVDSFGRVDAVIKLINEEAKPLAITSVHIHHDTSPDSEYADAKYVNVRTVISTNKGMWERVKTLDTDNDTWATGNINYTHSDGTLEESVGDGIPHLIRNMFKSVDDAPVGMIRSIVAARNAS